MKALQNIAKSRGRGRLVSRFPWPRSYYASAKGARVVGIALMCSLISHVGLAQEDEVKFNTDMLRSRGIDPALADYFRQAPRFREGTQVVALSVNGSRRGLVEAVFDRQGQLCFTTALLDKASLRIPRPEGVRSPGSQGLCHAFLAEFTQTVVTLRPNQDEVHLVVPTQAFREQDRELGIFTEGGTAGMFNYEMIGSENRSESNTSRFFSASTLAGFNVGSWIVRSRQQFVSSAGGEHLEHLYAYGQRDLGALQSTFQIGQINSAHPLFEGVPIYGIQLLPDQVSQSREVGGAIVEGIASSPSRVEVRQSGALIYSTLLPEGAFILAELPLLNGSSDLQVKMIDAAGAQREFVVPAASFHRVTQARPGYYASLGQLRSLVQSDAERPIIAALSGSWGLGSQVLLSGGVMGTADFQALGWGLDTRLFERVGVRVSNTAARHGRAGTQGVKSSFSVTSPLTDRLNLSLSATLRSPEYRGLLETSDRSDNREPVSGFRSQYSASLGWSDPWLGGLNLGYSHSALYNAGASQRLVGSWGRNFQYANVNLSVESELGSNRLSGGGTGVYLGVSIPLGGSRRLRAYGNRRGDRLALGTALSEQASDQVNYSVGVEGNTQRRDALLNANIGLLARYAQLNAGLARDDSSTSYSGHIKGGIAIHEDGLTFSPYPIQDTFGIVSVGDLSGVKLSTPHGPVWTDLKGRAVLAGLSAYRSSSIEVSTKSLPRRVDIKNGVKQLQPGRGSFSQVDFEIIKTRRLLLQLSDERGVPLVQGASVLTPDDRVLTTVVGAGKAFLVNVESRQKLKVRFPDARICEVELQLSEQPDVDQFYETATAICRAR